MADRDRLVIWPVALLWALALGFGIHAGHVRYGKAGADDGAGCNGSAGAGGRRRGRPRRVALRLLTDWPPNVWAVALAPTGLIPLALTLGTLPTMVARVDRLLTPTVGSPG